MTEAGIRRAGPAAKFLEKQAARRALENAGKVADDVVANIPGTPIGFARGTADDAVRNVGRVDHAGEKLTTVISGQRGSKAYREAVRSNAIRILENPTGTFDHVLTDGFKVKGFLGKIDGKDVVFFVAKEIKGKISAGELVSGWLPSPAQILDWGF